jgi:hypothetical protein
VFVESCEGSIDTVNGKIVDPTGAPVDVDNVAAIYGWTAISAQSGIAPQAVYLTITTIDGRRVFVATEPASRPDLSEHYRQSALENAGFRQTIDLSSFRDALSIGVARLVDGVLETCKNPQYRLVLSGKGS